VALKTDVPLTMIPMGVQTPAVTAAMGATARAVAGGGGAAVVGGVARVVTVTAGSRDVGVVVVLEGAEVTTDVGC
jgi:hypothetical protein